MEPISNGVLLRVFISESASFGNKKLFEAIVLKAKELGLADAIVFRSIMGFQGNHRMQSTKILMLSESLPVIIEIVDNEDNINKIIPFLNEVVTDGLVTSEKVNIIINKNNSN